MALAVGKIDCSIIRREPEGLFVCAFIGDRETRSVSRCGASDRLPPLARQLRGRSKLRVHTGSS